ncbi:MAG: DNA polymerase I [Armatimonadetes bacterium]|nr:DNA polymerase I [Armatimonadota bacterium]
MSKGKVILIDGNSLLYRAFFALPHFSTLENQPTNAIYGLAMMLLRLLEEEKPDIVIVSFDAPEKTFRHEEYVEYKAHRKRAPDELRSQGPIAREMIEAFNIPILEVPGYEADDVVGTVARKAESEGYDVIIVTGDLDALQLVDSKVKVMTTVRGVTETVIYDEKSVEARYSLKPKQLIDYKALKGDPSDNIPGVPGIGDKTAVKLIKEFGSLENILAHIDDIQEARLREQIRNSIDQALLSKRLATIKTDVPININLEQCRLRKPNLPKLRELFKRLEFRSLLKRLPEDNAQPVLEFESDAKVEELSEYKLVCNRPSLEALLVQIEKAGGFAFRIHGTAAHPINADALGVGVSVAPGKAYYVRFGENSGLSLLDFRKLLESEKIKKFGHNLKYEYEIARKVGIDIQGLEFDTMLAAYLINSSRNVQKLSDVVFDYLSSEFPGKEGTQETEQERLFAAEADAAMRLVSILTDHLVKDNIELLMYNIEMPLVPILGDMELTGVAVDSAWLGILSEKLSERINNLQKEIYTLAGMEFNIGSPKQLSFVLFDKLGLPAEKKTKTGFSTDADTLVALAPAHEIVEKILEYRELTKLKSTYADTLPKLINPKTGRIHTTLNQAVTTTGRLSSSEPNLQNIPIKTETGREIRRAFIAAPGNLLVSVDYSQIELRILAHVSRDAELLRAFREGEDIHTTTATRLFGVSADEVTPEMRRQAKTVNFAVIYGMSDYGLSRELNIPTGVAKKYIESYFQQYPGVRKYASETLEKARINGYVESLMGRRRYLPELNSANRVYREFAERAAVNMPIQGTAADIIKLAMIAVNERLKKSNLTANMVLQVHDELVFEVPENEVDELLNLVLPAMRDVYPLDVQLEVEAKVGKDWCTAQPVSVEEHIGA